MRWKTWLLAPLLLAAMLVATDKASDAAAVGSLSQASEWLNSTEITPKELRGNVVLVDFWTYTCVNWLRTLPYLRAFEQKYRDQGLVVIGVHSPEFEFEKDIDNVRRAARHLRVDFPIAVDSDHAIWRAFDNQYWPAVYLIDGRGRIRFHHFGESDYEGVERAIQKLLAENAQRAVPTGLVSVKGEGVEAAADWDNLRSPENYLGTLRTVGFSSPESIAKGKSRTYSVPRSLRQNSWALAGQWTITGDAVRLDRPNGRIVYRFHARDVNLVMRPLVPGDRRIRFRVLIDGQPPGTSHGADTDEQGFGTVDEPRLYQLIRQSGAIVDRQFEIEFLDESVAAFSFTFG